MRLLSVAALVALLLCLLAAPTAVLARRKHQHTPAADPVSPATYCLTFDTNVRNGTAEPVVIEITRTLSPLGADRLYALVQDGFFSALPAAFFRVVPRFVVQFGISGEPSMNSKWNVIIPDDPVVGSNTNGTITFATAGPNTRTTQLFINTADNPGLDAQGFSPLGRVVSGMMTMLTVTNPTPGSSDGVDQDAYTNGGYKWIESHYPMVNSIIKASVVNTACPK